jgi:hypothetical protein
MSNRRPLVEHAPYSFAVVDIVGTRGVSGGELLMGRHIRKVAEMQHGFSLFSVPPTHVLL